MPTRKNARIEPQMHSLQRKVEYKKQISNRSNFKISLNFERCVTIYERRKKHILFFLQNFNAHAEKKYRSTHRRISYYIF